jgi:hypothetical protein
MTLEWMICRTGVGDECDYYQIYRQIEEGSDEFVNYDPWIIFKGKDAANEHIDKLEAAIAKATGD